jgi:hypothetical protein
LINLKIAIRNWGEVHLDKRELKNLMRSAGNDVASKTRRLISRQDGSGRTYSIAGNRHQASAPGEPPTQITGKLRGSLKTYVYKDGSGFAVRERQFYSLFLEAGARGGGNPGGHRAARAQARRHARARNIYTQRVLLPRPHLDVVMAQEEKQLQSRVRRAFDQGLKWKETK